MAIYRAEETRLAAKQADSDAHCKKESARWRKIVADMGKLGQPPIETRRDAEPKAVQSTPTIQGGELSIRKGRVVAAILASRN